MAKQIKLNVVIPTSINIVGIVHENIVGNLLRAQDSDLEMPSLYRRAFMIVNEVGEIYTTEDVE